MRGLVRSGSLANHVDLTGVECVTGDIRDPACLGAAVEGADTIFHCAGLVGPAWLSEHLYEEVNAVGTSNLLAAAQRSKTLERFVHVSTVAVIGNVPRGSTAAEDSPNRPIDAYGRTKWKAEQSVTAAARQGFPAVVVRPMWIYGPGSRSTTRLFAMIARRRFVLVGSGQNTIQPIWIDDLVSALLLAASHPVKGGQIYHAAGSEIVAVSAFCHKVATAVRQPLPGWRVPMFLARPAAFACERVSRLWSGSPPVDHHKINFFRVNHAYSIERAAADLGWTPKISLDIGIRMTATSLENERTKDRS